MSLVLNQPQREVAWPSGLRDIERDRALVSIYSNEVGALLRVPGMNGGAKPRVSSPLPGFSTLITSAPRSPSIYTQVGPASTRVRSNTVRPFSGPACCHSCLAPLLTLVRDPCPSYADRPIKVSRPRYEPIREANHMLDSAAADPGGADVWTRRRWPRPCPAIISSAAGSFPRAQGKTFRRGQPGQRRNGRPSRRGRCHRRRGGGCRSRPGAEGVGQDAGPQAWRAGRPVRGAVERAQGGAGASHRARDRQGAAGPKVGSRPAWSPTSSSSTAASAAN